MPQASIPPPQHVEPLTHSMQGVELSDFGGPSQSSAMYLKRSASHTFEDAEGCSSRKRLKEDSAGPDTQRSLSGGAQVNGAALADELEQELQCGCCAALVYRPVLVSPCQHFFCGSCIVLWIKNGGTNCPACRGIANSVTPSRALQTMAEVLVKFSPSKARAENEKRQADDIYRAGTPLRIPIPRVPSPEPTIPQVNPNHVQPCPHCSPDNQWGWHCPQPIPDPEADPDNAWHSDDGNPPGHAYCGNCESILALQAPTTTKCDFCQVSFCGISVPGRCGTAPLAAQHLHSLSDIGDMIQCQDIYDVFDGNAVEVDILIDYMTAHNLSPRHIYREVIGMILSTPQGFQPLIDAEAFVDVHRVSGGVDPNPNAGARNRICRICATEILLWGLRAWWILERKKGLLDQAISLRPDCPDGRTCSRQKEHAHAKDFNHIILPPELQSLVDASTAPPRPPTEAPPLPTSGDSSSPTITNTVASQVQRSSASEDAYMAEPEAAEDESDISDPTDADITAALADRATDMPGLSDAASEMLGLTDAASLMRDFSSFMPPQSQSQPDKAGCAPSVSISASDPSGSQLTPSQEVEAMLTGPSR